MRVIILAAGKQDRFGHFKLKQLIEVEGEALIFRTIRQARKYTNDIIIVAHDKRLQVDGVGFFNPLVRDTTCHTLLSTKSIWDEETIILLGDVFFTDEAIDTIFTCDKPFQFFTDTGDFFAIAVKKEKQELFEEKLNLAILKWKMQNLWTCPILELYRVMGLPERICTVIDDRTQDFDRAYEYEDFKKGKSKNRIYENTRK